MLEARILEFIQAPVEAEFNRLALDSFRWQCERNPKLRALCVNRGREPEALRDWSEIPLVPTRSYKTTDLRTSEPQAVFRSSGTTQPQRSVHPHSHLDLYQTVIDATFPAACLTTTPPVDMLSLIPTRESMPESSLSYMIDHVVSRFGSAASLTAHGSAPLNATAGPSSCWPPVWRSSSCWMACDDGLCASACRPAAASSRPAAPRAGTTAFRAPTCSPPYTNTWACPPITLSVNTE
jgi:hypothetical protein